MLELHLPVGVIRGENAIVFLTADSTDFTDEVAGKATHEALIDAGRNISIVSIAKLAEALEVSIRDFFPLN